MTPGGAAQHRAAPGAARLDLRTPVSVWDPRTQLAGSAGRDDRAGAGAPERTPDWARAAVGAGILARDLGDTAAARAHLEASLEHGRALSEPGLTAWALRDLGQLRLQQGELEAAEGLLAEGLDLARATGDQRGAEPP